MSSRAARRFVEDLLAGRRPRPFAAAEDDEAELRTAILLRAARAGDGAPGEEFVVGLRERLARELDGVESAEPGGGRRRFIGIAAAAAAAAAGGAAVDHVLTGSAAAPGTDGPRTLVPDEGEWHAVAAAEELPDGAVRPFDVGAVAGFVRRDGGRVAAVSGTCTHLGCRLALDAPARRLNCPCHLTCFAVDGAVVSHELPAAPPALPEVLVRESGGAVEVFVPPRST